MGGVLEDEYIMRGRLLIGFITREGNVRSIFEALHDVRMLQC